ncbi:MULTISPECIES: hypothetical protein [Aminobacterium]|uniref:hypothetical protein n=4 Tax=Aminobacteriaceae TaxID=3029087 RepID=UPI0004AD98DC|nr:MULTISPECIES: hypothetical protein [Aminobacterium]
MMRKIIMKTLCVCVMALLALPSGGGQCFANIDIVGDLTYRFNVSPGQEVRGQIAIRNYSKEESVQVSINQNDYHCYADGRNEYPSPGSHNRSNALWMALSPRQLIIPPDSIGTFEYVICTPKEESLRGTYWSLIIVEPIGQERLQVPDGSKEDMAYNVTTVFKYAIQMITDVGTSGVQEIQFIDKRLRTVEGMPVLDLDIENTGERVIRPVVWAELYDQQGNQAGKFEGGRRWIYPGSSCRFEIPLKGIKPGDYKVLLVADGGEDEAFGAQYALVVK